MMHPLPYRPVRMPFDPWPLVERVDQHKRVITRHQRIVAALRKRMNREIARIDDNGVRIFDAHNNLARAVNRICDVLEGVRS